MMQSDDTKPDAVVMTGDTQPPQFPLTKSKKHSNAERQSLLEWLLASMPLDGDDAEVNFRLAFDEWWKQAADVPQDPEPVASQPDPNGLMVFAPPEGYKPPPKLDVDVTVKY